MKSIQGNLNGMTKKHTMGNPRIKLSAKQIVGNLPILK